MTGQLTRQILQAHRGFVWRHDLSCTGLRHRALGPRPRRPQDTTVCVNGFQPCIPNGLGPDWRWVLHVRCPGWQLLTRGMCWPGAVATFGLYIPYGVAAVLAFFFPGLGPGAVTSLNSSRRTLHFVLRWWEGCRLRSGVCPFADGRSNPIQCIYKYIYIYIYTYIDTLKRTHAYTCTVPLPTHVQLKPYVSS